MTNIFDQYQAAFNNVSAYAVMKEGEIVANIVFKFPKNGAGRVFAYVHWLGLEMVRGSATGGGYDKRSAAVSNAADNAVRTVEIDAEDINLARTTFFRELQDADGRDWTWRLRDAGFCVHQVV